MDRNESGFPDFTHSIPCVHQLAATKAWFEKVKLVFLQ
jgi:hypothetical protein